MNPGDYLQEQICTLGTTLYYATLFTPPERKNALLSILGLQREFVSIPQICTDPGIARIRLQWWREELRAAGTTQRTRHPLTHALATYCPIVLQRGMPQLQSAVDAAELVLNAPRSSTPEELRRRYEHSHGGMWALSRFLSKSNLSAIANDDQLIKLGCLIGINEDLQYLGLHAERGLLPLPTQTMPTPTLSREHGADATWQAFLKNFAQHMEDELHRQLDEMSPRHRLDELHAVIFGRILLATWVEIRRDGTRLLTHRTDLTPLRKLWLAWREFRIAKRLTRN